MKKKPIFSLYLKLIEKGQAKATPEIWGDQLL